MLRTHTCGELTEKDVDREVTLCGWVHRRRDHGDVIFIDIRDRYGLTQVVFNPSLNEEAFNLAKTLGAEFVVKTNGRVSLRPEANRNKKLSTGAIEVSCDSLSILNCSDVPPFEIRDKSESSEEVRFKYRYIDLRRPSVQAKFLMRHNLYKTIRDFLDRLGFIEFETPILTKSTPEGARDFLVPSRLNVGNFYALPQSPQLFKQILMVSGFDRYFQIARCFRDEDLRADRQPEFTQLDMEMSFVEEEDIYELMEGLMKEIMRSLCKGDLKTPFPRLKFSEAIKRYNSDKPDLRKDKEEFRFLWVEEFPLFKFDDEEKRWTSEHHPFTAPNEEDLNTLKSDPSSVRSRAYDLVLNGVEIASGSIRINTPEIQRAVFEVIGLDVEEAKARFGFLLDALNFGAPPHGGIALGLDRFLTLLTKDESIREVIAFPKTQKATCLLTDAPSSVEAEQLRELGLTVRQE